jgi:hypothetical protein
MDTYLKDINPLNMDKKQFSSKPRDFLPQGENGPTVSGCRIPAHELRADQNLIL